MGIIFESMVNYIYTQTLLETSIIFGTVIDDTNTNTFLADDSKPKSFNFQLLDSNIKSVVALIIRQV